MPDTVSRMVDSPWIYFFPRKGHGDLDFPSERDMVISKWKRLNAVAKDHGILKMGFFHPICRVTQISERLDHVYWVTPIRIRTGEILQSVNLLSWIPANVHPIRAHAFLLSLPFNQSLTQSFITFSTISDESSRRRRIRPLIPPIFLQLILYQRLTHLVVGSLASSFSSLHSPRGRSQSALIISGTSTQVIVPMYCTYLFPWPSTSSTYPSPTLPAWLPPPTLKQNKKKVEGRARSRDLMIFNSLICSQLSVRCTE